MTNWMSKTLVVTGVSVMMSVVGGAPVAAQQSPSPAVDKNAVVLIPGVMTGPGAMGPRGFRRLCTPRSVGLYEWQVRWLERVVRSTEAQRAALNDLQSASSKAIATMATACKAEMPTTTKAELEMMDNRLEIMSQAVKTLRPAFDAFYASLDNKQQQRLDVFGPRHRGWRW
ncbi:MAG TPA: Spy/CpxP family protein refolding chaperone [Candidatus Acidoferrales bacterium]|nr:Spy/CpxP family protein refolding chaperone [Candidatus Acidoferrales bacterium]